MGTTIPLALIVLTLLLGCAAGPVLATRDWPRRMPTVAALTWLGALGGTMAAGLGLIVLLFAGPLGLGHHIVQWSLSCLDDHPHPGGVVTGAVSLCLVFAAIAGIGSAGARFHGTMTARRRHGDALRFVAGQADDLDDVCVLDHPIPVVYCLPKATRPIVVSSGALTCLEKEQLNAVLAHERTHIRHRHHLAVAIVDAVAAALPWLPTFRLARDIVPRLLEMAADDSAARRHGHKALAAALRKIAVPRHIAGAMGAGGTSRRGLSERLARLEGSTRPAEPRPPLTLATAAASVCLPVIICVISIAAIPLSC